MDAEAIANALKPPRCPKCGAEIDHLIYYARELVEAKFYVTDSDCEYSNWNSLDTDCETIEYCCPKCDGTLFRDEDDAVTFLRGGTPFWRNRLPAKSKKAKNE